MSGTLENIQVNSFDDFRKIENIASKLGGTARTALEFAIFNYKGGYKFLGGRKLPRPLGNVLGGGMHKDNSTLDFQEFLIISHKVKTFSEAVEKNLKFYKKMHDKIKELDKNFKDAITDEGAWSPSLDNERVLKLLKKHVRGFGLKIGVDMAASSFFKNNLYQYKDKQLTKDEQIDYVNSLIKKYDLYYVEDPLHQDDFSGCFLKPERYGTSFPFVLHFVYDANFFLPPFQFFFGPVRRSVIDDDDFARKAREMSIIHPTNGFADSSSLIVYRNDNAKLFHTSVPFPLRLSST